MATGRSRTADTPPPPGRLGDDAGCWGLWIVASPDTEAVGRCVAPTPTEPVVLGRKAHADPNSVAVADRRVSAPHVRIEAVKGRPGYFQVEDLGSRHKVFVNRRPVHEAFVRPQDVVRVGATLLVSGARLVDRSDELGMTGSSAEIERVRRQVRQAARHADPVYVRGETGAGKELVARAIHEVSSRDGPLVATNVAVLEPQLAASELFGHVRGAFSGANASRDGLFLAAHGGTLFLDEIAELGADVQTKLLRALERGEVRPVGAERTKAVDARLVTASQRPLEELVEAGSFRSDLMFRLIGSEIVVPPLRARRVDIVPLFWRFLEEALDDDGDLVRAPEQAWALANVLEILLTFYWPGNVRQLRWATRQLAWAVQEAGYVPAPTECLRPNLLGNVEPVADAAPERVGSPENDPAEAARLRAALGDPERLHQILHEEHHGNIAALSRAIGQALDRNPSSVRRRIYEVLDRHPEGRR